MKKIILLIGAANSGKTTCINELIKDLVTYKNYRVKKYFDDNSPQDFWETQNEDGKAIDGSVLLQNESQTVAIISYGDYPIPELFSQIQKEDPDVLLCCSRSYYRKNCTKSFMFWHKEIDAYLSADVEVIPIDKNMLARHNCAIDNAKATRLLKSLL